MEGETAVPSNDGTMPHVCLQASRFSPPTTPTTTTTTIHSPSVFRAWVGQDELKFKPQANRYHLYVSLACPWSAACLMAMHLKGEWVEWGSRLW
jgi:hypothetical protein